MARLGVFGGSFDPPHLGHLALAEAALRGLGLGRVLWVLTPAPPHKQGWNISPLAVRERMVTIMVEQNPQVDFSRVEMERRGPHFMGGTRELYDHPVLPPAAPISAREALYLADAGGASPG